jgi:hypothetical protein
VATRRQNGTLRSARIVWIVRRDDVLDDAYGESTGASSAVARIAAPTPRATTLRVVQGRPHALPMDNEKG